jgi:hypothetical protein
MIIRNNPGKISLYLLLILLFLLVVPATLYSQEGGEESSPEAEEEPPSSENENEDEEGQDEEEPEENLGVFRPYSLGDQFFSLKAGLFIPLFFGTPNWGVEATNLTLGGTGNIEWGAFLNSSLSLGADLSGMFAFSPLERTLIIIPLTAKLTWWLRAGSFDFPLHMELGVNFTKLDADLYFGMIVKPGVSAYWNMNSEWSFGLNVVYWWVPQWYARADMREYTRYGNFMNVTVSALYHF